MLVVAATLTLLTLTGFITPSILLLLTFLLGVGAAVSIPSAMGSAMELVPKPDAQHVITLGGISINIGFAVGPILGGLVVAAYGPWSVFMLNALSFVGLIIFHQRWHRAPYSGQLPPERVVGAMRAALRYVRHSTHIHGLFVRDLAFSISSSSLMALLPVLTRQVLGLGSTGFGGTGRMLWPWSYNRRFSCPSTATKETFDRMDDRRSDFSICRYSDNFGLSAKFCHSLFCNDIRGHCTTHHNIQPQLFSI